MAKKFHIVVEGKEDKLFMTEYLKHLNLSSSVDDMIKNLEGIDKLTGYTQKMQEYWTEDVKILLIVDANSDHRQRRQDIEDAISKEMGGIKLPLFLFPDDKSVGAIEELLVQIILPKHKDIFTCVENYKKCLKSICSKYIVPPLKGKIYGYKEAIGALIEEKPFDKQYWDYDHSALSPLKKFLTDNIG